MQPQTGKVTSIQQRLDRSSAERQKLLTNWHTIRHGSCYISELFIKSN